MNRTAAAPMPPGISGFSYADLHVPSRLKDQYDVFSRDRAGGRCTVAGPGRVMITAVVPAMAIAARIVPVAAHHFLEKP